ncbi:hypothetical protein AUH73_02300 [archaeon 13_1_40CM_4_53_4]|nr:MAG: hypothetical protein AUH73_02300 [archaeon 13_1_40CM_4_53_4]OLD14717.1 MAG: hypothetical protein AUI97_00995 [Crenarchaeota archaeon 13_1_40CM_3_52_17]OLE91718.1 MAG: hypothetical protein AUF79_02775 [Crenarchaeota archaeon 13_1_20CM_2_51_8]
MLEAVIGILGRSVFPEDKLRDMVTKYKKNPEQYVRGYNLCDGEHAVIDIAKEIGVAGPTLSPILTDWKDRGIIYEVTKTGGKFYRKLYKLEEKHREQSNEDKVPKPTPTSESALAEQPEKTPSIDN